LAVALHPGKMSDVWQRVHPIGMCEQALAEDNKALPKARTYLAADTRACGDRTLLSEEGARYLAAAYIHELRAVMCAARGYAIKRPPGTSDRAWQHAMKPMMEAAESGEADAVTKQLERRC